MQQLTSIFLFAVSVITIESSAQFSRGTQMTGASIGNIFINSGNSDQTVSSIGSTSAKVTGYGVNIVPLLGWFVSEKTAAGFSLNISPSGEKITFEENGSTFQKDKSDYFNIGVGGFARNYFSSSGSFLPFGQFNLDGGISNVKKNGFFYGGNGSSAYKETYDSKSSGGIYINASFTAGLTKMLGQNTGLDIYAGYIFSYNKNTVKTTRLKDIMIDGTIDETLKNETTSKFTNHKFIIGIGFQVFLEKKKR